MVMLLLEVGLHASAHGLHDEPVMLAIDGRKARLLAADDLVDEETTARQSLEDELLLLREAAAHDGDVGYRETGAVGGRFWYFPDHARVTIVCTPLSDRQLGLNFDGTIPKNAAPLIGYSRPSHPNYIESLRNGDSDALIELVGHIRAENPTIEVRWMTPDEVGRDELSGNLVILGGPDPNPHGAERGPLWWFSRRLELPVRVHLPDAGTRVRPEFVVNTDEEGKPTFRGAKAEVLRACSCHRVRTDRSRVFVDGALSRYDTALIVRKPNPINPLARSRFVRESL